MSLHIFINYGLVTYRDFNVIYIQKITTKINEICQTLISSSHKKKTRSNKTRTHTIPPSYIIMLTFNKVLYTLPS